MRSAKIGLTDGSAGLTAGRFRVGAAGAGVALVVALTGTQVVATATTERAMRHSPAAQLRAGHVIVSRRGSGLPADVAEAARRIPGVRVTPIATTGVYLLDHGLTHDEEAWNVVGVSGDHRPALALDVTACSLSAVRRDTIAVSRTVAFYGHVGVGSVVHARLADGTAARLRIGAVYRHGSGFGDLVLPGGLARTHEVARVDHAVLITGAHSPAAMRALHVLAAGLGVGVLVTAICFAGVGHDRTAGPLTVPGDQAALVLGGATLLGVCGQLIPAMLARRTRPATLVERAG